MPAASSAPSAPPLTGPRAASADRPVLVFDRVSLGRNAPAHRASMANMWSACVASACANLRTGSAAAMTMMPVVPDYSVYPTGRDLKATTGEIGLSGHWVKLMLHHLFLYKAKGHIGWQFIPE